MPFFCLERPFEYKVAGFLQATSGTEEATPEPTDHERAKKEKGKDHKTTRSNTEPCSLDDDRARYVDKCHGIQDEGKDDDCQPHSLP